MPAHPPKMFGARLGWHTVAHIYICKNIFRETMGNTYVAFVQGTPLSLPGRKFVAKILQGTIFIDFGLFGKRFWKDVGTVLFLC
jgi:hypothetical protein